MAIDRVVGVDVGPLKKYVCLFVFGMWCGHTLCFAQIQNSEIQLNEMENYPLESVTVPEKSPEESLEESPEDNPIKTTDDTGSLSLGVKKHIEIKYSIGSKDRILKEYYDNALLNAELSDFKNEFNGYGWSGIWKQKCYLAFPVNNEYVYQPFYITTYDMELYGTGGFLEQMTKKVLSLSFHPDKNSVLNPNTYKIYKTERDLVYEGPIDTNLADNGRVRDRAKLYFRLKDELIHFKLVTFRLDEYYGYCVENVPGLSIY